MGCTRVDCNHGTDPCHLDIPSYDPPVQSKSVSQETDDQRLGWGGKHACSCFASEQELVASCSLVFLVRAGGEAQLGS